MVQNINHAVGTWKVYGHWKSMQGLAMALTFPYLYEEPEHGRVQIWLVQGMGGFFFYRCRHFCLKDRTVGACCTCAGNAVQRWCEVCYGRLPRAE